MTDEMADQARRFESRPTVTLHGGLAPANRRSNVLVPASLSSLARTCAMSATRATGSRDPAALREDQGRGAALVAALATAFREAVTMSLSRPTP